MSSLSEQDFKIGRELLLRGLPTVVFSDRTYQVEVTNEDGASTSWVFLGLGEEDQLIDYFCQCDTFGEVGSCPHAAAAYLFAYLEEHKALHVRYFESLWYILFFIAARRHGFIPKVVKNAKGFSITSSNGKELFSFKAKSKERLSELVFERQKENEENSIKFSNLDSHELKLYKEGRPSIEFQFELSLWSDLSKWIMTLEAQGKNFTLKFDEGQMGLPSEIHVHFEEVEFSMYLAKSNWEEILHFLKNHNSPLPVYESGSFSIKEMFYDKEQEVMVLRKEFFEEKGAVVDLGDWLFRKGFGFFPKEVDPLFGGDQISDLSLLFRSHLDLVKRKLKGEKIHLERAEPQYHLLVDTKGNLHIGLYVFKKGDLSSGKGRYFHPWAFVDGYGFVRIKEPLFEEAKKVIKREKMGEFITQYRAWLSTFEGFETHLSHMEATLTYEVMSDKSLRFVTGDVGPDNKDHIDLGEWIYIRGEGFFAKNRGGAHSFLKSGMQMGRQDVNGFIRSHEPELELVQGFFSRRSPILKMGLDIRYNENGIIEVQPELSYTAGYGKHNVTLYGEYAYITGEGFFRIPEKALVPAGYEKPKEIPSFLEQHFLFQELPGLMPYVFEIDPRLVKPESLRLQIESIESDPKKGMWKLKCALVSEIGKTSLEPLFYAARTQKPFLASSAGLILIKESTHYWLSQLREANLLKEGLKISSIQWIHLLAHQSVEFSPSCDPELVKILKQFSTTSLDDLDMPALTGLKSQLRPYQEMGIRWIYHLYRNHLSGILADEMGLGKTHQAMGLIAAGMNHLGAGAAKFFVVCPTSVVYHWENLLKEFLPEVRVRVYYGAERSLEGEWDLLLTSYGTLRGDIAEIKKVSFEIAVFDEMQSAKNRQSQIHKSLKSVTATMKMGLTGTPIENDLTELKALFDILIPSLFPSDETFKELFINPIERGEDKDRYHLLKKLIAPFILRRKKSEVLQDLPEKIEEISYVDLSDEQRQMYNQLFTTGFHELEQIEQNEKPKLYLHIFALLTKLKQVCDHPCLITKNIENYEEHTSGKFELFKELLEEARQSGQKVVVFTQYIDMLRMIKKYLDAQGIQSAMIHGQIRDRRAEVERFRDDPKCEVFIASLGAAGVGIDLTEASVVIHFDRWWNPARENQATDRVHRYGQTRGVQVFKFVCKNTIEEHIHAIIEKKQSLMQDVIGFDDQDQMKKIDPKELMEMMRRISE